MREIAVRSFRIGDIVYGKMKHYAPWPAVITNIEGRQVRLRFFGDGTWFVNFNFILYKFLLIN